MQTLEDFNTGTEVACHEIPPDAAVSPTKFVLKKKKDSLDDFTSAKARLVVCANWVKGVFQSLFAPTVNEKSLKLLFALAPVDLRDDHHWHRCQRIILIPLHLSSKTSHSFSTGVLEIEQDVVWVARESSGIPSRCQQTALAKWLLSHHGRSLHVLETGTRWEIYFYGCPCGRLCNRLHTTDQIGIDELLTILRTRYTMTTSDSLEYDLGIHGEYLSNGNVRFTQPAKIEELMRE
jgi:hypothetical protein